MFIRLSFVIMKTIHSVYDLPSVPAVYVMYGGRDRKYIAYVGIGDDLKRRVQQHLVKKDSSVVTGTSAVVLNPDYVTEVKWWEDPIFSSRNNLFAAELVAFDYFDPALRSRGNIPKDAVMISQDETFVEKMRNLFSGKPNGKLVLSNVETLMKRIEALENRVQDIEDRQKEN